jgi:hypothetical protein
MAEQDPTKRWLALITGVGIWLGAMVPWLPLVINPDAFCGRNSFGCPPENLQFMTLSGWGYL